ncbi:hypothetical protein HDU78_009582 [Chytriomyces hyalinus]|nr:hypothetical protein HDU78_009582 [Chytriomyces hyalinus]
MSALFSFRKQYAQYAEYHDVAVNQRIHTVFVPMLVFTAMVMINSATAPFGEWPLDQLNIAFNAASVLWSIYAVYYVILHPVLGGSAAAALFGCLWVSNAFVAHAHEVTGMDAFTLALGLHVFSWIVQFVGHGVFEGRAPALLDNLLQALVLAFFFVWTHSIFDLGFYPDLAQEFKAETKKRVQAFKAKKLKKAI